MWNVLLYEAQTGTKIARRNVNNLRYADDTTLMAESEEELKSLWTMMKEEHEKGGFFFIGDWNAKVGSQETPGGEVKSLSHVRLSVTPWTVAYQAPLSMGFSRQ